jgi:hypothetical protein
VKGVDVWHKDSDVRPVRLGSLQMTQDVRFPEADDSLGEVEVTLSLTVLPSVGIAANRAAHRDAKRRSGHPSAERKPLDWP